jgi:hypothetical protein
MVAKEGKTRTRVAIELGCSPQNVRDWELELKAGNHKEDATTDWETIKGALALGIALLGLIWAIIGGFTEGGGYVIGRLILTFFAVAAVVVLIMVFDSSEDVDKRVLGPVVGGLMVLLFVMSFDFLSGGDTGSGEDREAEPTDQFDRYAEQTCTAAMSMQISVAEGGADGLSDVYVDALTDISQGARRTEHTRIGNLGEELYDASFEGRSRATANHHENLIRACDREMVQ